MPHFRMLSQLPDHLTYSRYDAIHFQMRPIHTGLIVWYAARGIGRTEREMSLADKVELTRAVDRDDMHRKLFEDGFRVTDPTAVRVMRSLVGRGYAEEASSQ